ncbi:MAG: metal ABC transporter ATP-binding protein [Patescibacteria group bacterium]
MSAELLNVQNLSVTLQGKSILNKISFSLKEGDFAAIIGPNGAGKTILIKAILGLIPYTGDVVYNSESIAKSLTNIGYVPQRFIFDKNFPITVKELLQLRATPQNKERIMKSLQEVEMDHKVNALLGELSGGQLQRVLIAQSLINDPDLLILDEPTTGIDMEGEKDFYEIIKHQHEKHNVTILMISHEINMVHTYANKVICLNKDLRCFGKPTEAINSKVMKELYGNDFEYRLHDH